MEDDAGEDQVQPRPNLSRNPACNLPNRVVYNSKLIAMPTTVPGSSNQQDVDEEEHADEVIRPLDILDPQRYFLVDRYNRTIIMPHASDLQPQMKATKAISYVIQANYHEPWLNWTQIKKAKNGDEPVWLTFWNAFKTKCTWLSDHEDIIRGIFDHKCSRRLSDLLVDARSAHHEGKKPPKWLGDVNGDLWKGLIVKWGTDAYKKKCAQAKKNRLAQPDAGLHKAGSTSSSTIRIRFEQVISRKPTLDDMNEYLHCKDGIWDTVRAERASTLIREYMNKLKASEAALPPEQRLCDEVLHNQILDKFVEFSGGKKKGHIQGQGSTSSFIQRTPAGYIDVSSRPFNNPSMSTDRFASAPVESREEFQQRIRAETQESMKKFREDILQEVAGQRVEDQYQNSNSFNNNFSNNSGNQSNQQQRRQHNQSSQQNFQRQQQQHRRPPVQQNQAIGRNSMSSSHQQDQFIEDEYRPQNVDFMDTNQVFEPDASFFEGFQNDPLLQSVMREDEFEPFQNASQNNPTAWNPAAWNQGGDVPLSSPGINFNQSGGNTYINQRDSRTLGGIIHGSTTYQFNDGSRRTSAGRAGAGRSDAGRADGSASGGRTSASVGGRARGRSGGGQAETHK
ncbi:hypothetical protein QL285_003346 [Trifolium repens]|nr:hypothetical protein QL285_003346 [Trifolium repens]